MDASHDRMPGLLTQGGESDVERIFQHFFRETNLFSTIPHHVWGPPTDVYETPDAYVISIEIPGVEEDEVKMELNHNVLSIRGHRRDRSTDTKLGFNQMEIHYGYFEKVVTLPHSIDPDTRSATYNGGFLRISIGKAEPQLRARRRIEIDF